jgi:hypothetical protein
LGWIDFQEVGCGYVDWIGLDQDRDRWRTLVSEVMNLRVPWNAGNFLTSCKPVSFSRRTLHRGVSKWVKISKNTSYKDPPYEILSLYLLLPLWYMKDAGHVNWKTNTTSIRRISMTK